MKKDPRPRPPSLARSIVALRTPPELREEVLGDLEEAFVRDAASSPATARWRYWREATSLRWGGLRGALARSTLGPTSPLGTRASWRWGWGRDLRLAARVLWRAPFFSAVAILSLAVGIGPSAGLFTLANRVLLSDWGVESPETLIDIYPVGSRGGHSFASHGLYEQVRDGLDGVFDKVAGYAWVPARVELDGSPRPVVLEIVTPEYFDVMGVGADRGRLFSDAEVRTGAPLDAVVVSHRFWTTRMAGDPAAVGGPLRLDGRNFTVVGVTPATFRGRFIHGVSSDVFVPWDPYVAGTSGRTGTGNFLIAARLAPGVSPGRASEAVDALAARINGDRGGSGPLRLAAIPLSETWIHPDFDPFVAGVLTLFFALAAIVLLVACVNVAGFFLARATDRRQEIAIRMSIGAGRSVIVRQLLAEAFLVAAIGGGLALVLARGSLAALLAVEPPTLFPLDLDVGLEWPVLLFTALVSGGAALAFGLVPALRATDRSGLRRLGKPVEQGTRWITARGALVTAQMALSTVLLVAAALFLRSLQAASAIDPGFSTDPAGVVVVGAWSNGYEATELRDFVDGVTRRLQDSPGVEVSTVSSRLPLGLGTSNLSLEVPGVPPPTGRGAHTLQVAHVVPGYFSAMGIRLTSGRGFEPQDDEDGEPVAVISQAMAERFWPGEDAVGQRFNPPGQPELSRRVVGVATSARIWSLSEAPRPYVYLPFDQAPVSTFSIVARGPLPDAVLAASVRDAARGVDPEIHLESVQTLHQHLSLNLYLPRLGALVLSLLGGAAVLLAGVGLWGTVSYGVARRTRELGIRLALGADRRRLVGMVVRGGVGILVVGGLVGMVLALAGVGLLRRFLVAVTPFDPVALVAGPLILALVGLAAAYLPARRTTQLDPVEALRPD